MMHIKPVKPVASDLLALDQKQNTINAFQNHSDRVAEAQSLWRKKNVALFSRLRSGLAAAQKPRTFCQYCEQSEESAIEHIYPKAYYPERTFFWTNYLLACTRCNSTYKRDKFAVFFSDSKGKVDIVTLTTAPPPQSKPVFIDPRSEKPLDYIRLDLQTGFFIPDITFDLTSPSFIRADYTIDALALNRNDLPRCRRNQFLIYCQKLDAYISATQGKRAIRADILDDPHPTVWAEMKRQHSLIPKLKTLFTAAPEALNW
jgi:uncharacterized protein (TIGR02646 family)